MQNKSPLLTMLPNEVLAKAKKLAAELHAENLLKDLVGRRLFSMVITVILLIFFNAYNALIFGEIAIDHLSSIAPWVKPTLTVYSLFVWLGGTLFMYSAVVARLEVIALRGADPIYNISTENLRFYRRSTWLPLIPLSLLPALVNFLFNVTFFFFSIALLLVFMLLFQLRADHV